MSVQHQIMWNRLISIVEEQAQALVGKEGQGGR